MIAALVACVVLLQSVVLNSCQCIDGYSCLSRSLLIKAASFQMGTNRKLPPPEARVARRAHAYVADREYPAHRERVHDFLLDVHPITNAEFAEFVRATEHVTDAQHYQWSFTVAMLLTDAQKRAIENEVAGAPWWLPLANATWRRPEGPSRPGVFDASDSLQTAMYSAARRDRFPVVHVSHRDASAFCEWRGGRLPTEAEYEYAARGKLHQKMFAWGSGDQVLGERGQHMMNVWQGDFPRQNTAQDGYVALAPVMSYAPNAHGIYGLLGNTWEWVADKFDGGGDEARSSNVYTQKGGSFMCHASYCYRYRTSARHSAEADSSAINVSFRCAFSVAPPAAVPPATA